MNIVTVPLDYAPKFELCRRESRNRYFMTYLIPGCDKKISLTLPESIQTKEAAWEFKFRKNNDLLKGILTDKEYQKFKESRGHKIVSFDFALSEYKKIDVHKKKKNTQETDNYCVATSLKWLQELKNSKGKQTCVNLNDVEQDHIFQYKDWLLSQAELRKSAEENFRKKSAKIKDPIVIKEMKSFVRTQGISYASAETKLRRLFTFFNKLNNKKILKYNPCSDVSKIAPKTSDKVRSVSPTTAEIGQILEARYEHRYGFPIQDFILFLAETGARLGEALHFEFKDIQSGIWRIKEKKDCPTKHEMGWSPKFDRKRDIALTPRALEIVERMKARAKGRRIVGYIKGDFIDGDAKWGKVAYDAEFVFTINDYGRHNKGGLRRCDDIKKAWASLLKEANVRVYSFDGINLHDFRRYRNEMNDKVKGMSAKERGKQIGNSEHVNKNHYSGQLDDEILQMAAEIRALKEEIISLKERNQTLESELLASKSEEELAS